MQKIILCFLVISCISSVYGQTVTILDSLTREPLEAVVLLGTESHASAVTDKTGQADLSNFIDNEIIQFRSLVYKTRSLQMDEVKALNYSVALEKSSMQLDQVVIAATRWRQSYAHLPNKVASISAREITLQNPQTAADMLSISGKVFVQKSQQGGGSPMIRGFATNRLLYTVDGVRMNNAIFRGGNIQNVINLDPFAIERTEVLFGPGSVIYGSDAIGGVMSFTTKEALLSESDRVKITGSATARYAYASNEKTGHVDLNAGFRKWAFRTSFSSWDYDNLRQGKHGPDDYIKDFFVERQNGEDVTVMQENPLLQIPSAYSQINLMQKVRFKPNAEWDLKYGFHYSETSEYGRYDRHNRVRNGLPRYGEWRYGPQKWMMNNLSVHHSPSQAFYDEATLRLAQQSFEESRISRIFNETERSTQKEEVEAYSLNLDFVKSLASGHVLFYGFEYVRNDVQSSGFFTDIDSGSNTPGISRYPDADWNSTAVYLNTDIELNTYVSLQGGLRYNHIRLNADFSNNLDFFLFPFRTTRLDQGSLTGSLGAVFRSQKGWLVKINAASAFRSPNVDDLGKVFDSEPGALTIPNPDLNAEYAYSFDMGVAKVFNDRVKLDFSAYYTILNNALVRRDFQLNGQDSIIFEGVPSRVQAIQNAAVAKVYGIQAGLEIKLTSKLKWISDFNIQNGEEELDDGGVSPSRHAAPFYGMSRLQFKSGKLSMEFNVQYQGERSFEDLAVEERAKVEIYAQDANGNSYAPEWYTLNLKALYKFSDLLSFSGGIENITDQRYRPYSSGISGAGRNFILSFRTDF